MCGSMSALATHLAILVKSALLYIITVLTLILIGDNITTTNLQLNDKWLEYTIPVNSVLFSV